MASTSYSAGNLLRRALLGVVLLVAFTAASAWLLHATTAEAPPKAGIGLKP